MLGETLRWIAPHEQLPDTHQTHEQLPDTHQTHIA